MVGPGSPHAVALTLDDRAGKRAALRMRRGARDEMLSDVSTRGI